MEDSFEVSLSNKNLIEVKKELEQKYSILKIKDNLILTFLIDEFEERDGVLFAKSKISEKIFHKKIIEHLKSSFDVNIKLDESIVLNQEKELNHIKTLLNDVDNYHVYLFNKISENIKKIENSDSLLRHLRLLLDNKKKFLLLEYEDELLYVTHDFGEIKYVCVYNYFHHKKTIEKFLNVDFSMKKNSLINTKKKIIGHDSIVEEIFNLIEMRKYNFFRNNEYLIGSLLFSGDTGTGKTQLANTISEEAFLKDPLIIDCSTLTNPDLITNTFFGSGRGFSDSDLGGIFNENNIQNRVILFDEVEKAHNSLFLIIMNILDRGFAFDARTSEKIIFKESLIILTTNIVRTLEQESDLQTELILSGIPREVLGRIDKYYFFNNNFSKNELIDIGFSIFEDAVKLFPFKIEDKTIKYFINKENIKKIIGDNIPEKLDFGIRELRNVIFKTLEEKYYPNILKEIKNKYKKKIIVVFE